MIDKKPICPNCNAKTYKIYHRANNSKFTTLKDFYYCERCHRIVVVKTIDAEV